MEIRHLKHNEIDFIKWDNCILSSPQGLAYHMSWYLNITNPEWEALVEGDYECVMPLPVRCKYGFKYLIQPFLSQQLGVVSVLGNVCEISNFLKKASGMYRYVNINLNRYNDCNNPDFVVSNYNNHELNLDQSIESIEVTYSRRTRRNICFAKECNLHLDENIAAKDFTYFKAAYSFPRLSNRFKNILENLVNYSIHNGFGSLMAVKNPKGELISAAFYFWFKNRIYLLVTASSDEGKNTSAMYLIIEKLINENVGENKILDFTGSNLEGVAYFNEGFGALPEHYKNIYLNKLPLIIRLFKT